MGRVHLGTSGYAYAHWKNLFYPPGLATSGWLAFYAKVFSSVELNATFYRLPSPEAVDRWRQEVPGAFRFVCKGSQYLTHMKRLTETGAGLDRFYGPVMRLKEKLTGVLWQLPPRMSKPDPERLHRFLSAQPPGVRQILEFRNAGWYTEEVYAVLDEHGAALCEHDLLEQPPMRHTGGFRYLRFHGKTGKYSGRYGRRALRPFAKDLTQWTVAGKDALVFFNNDQQGHAIADALELADLLDLPGAEERSEVLGQRG